MTALLMLILDFFELKGTEIHGLLNFEQKTPSVTWMGFEIYTTSVYYASSLRTTAPSSTPNIALYIQFKRHSTDGPTLTLPLCRPHFFIHVRMAWMKKRYMTSYYVMEPRRTQYIMKLLSNMVQWAHRMYLSCSYSASRFISHTSGLFLEWAPL